MDTKDSIRREFWKGAGYTGEQIEKMDAEMETEHEIMCRPDTDPEKIALIFKQA